MDIHTKERKHVFKSERTKSGLFLFSKVLCYLWYAFHTCCQQTQRGMHTDSWKCWRRHRFHRSRSGQQTSHLASWWLPLVTGVPCSKITLLFRQERDRQTDRQMDVGGTICNIDKSECSDICLWLWGSSGYQYKSTPCSRSFPYLAGILFWCGYVVPVYVLFSCLFFLFLHVTGGYK